MTPHESGREPDWVRDGLSLARFRPYLDHAHGDVTAAIDLYWWNVAVSAAFYAPLHVVEVALRNGLHRQLTIGFRRTDWWSATPSPLRAHSRRMIDNVRTKLDERQRPYTPDDIVSSLTLGFWVSLISHAYDQSLWVPHLHRAFPGYHGPRAALHTELETIRLFRNRVMHHEPIHHRHLEADHDTILRVLAYLSTDLVEQLKPYDQVPLMLARRPGGSAPGDGGGR